MSAAYFIVSRYRIPQSQGLRQMVPTRLSLVLAILRHMVVEALDCQPKSHTKNMERLGDSSTDPTAN